jgi:myosin-light-chain kinase
MNTSLLISESDGRYHIGPVIGRGSFGECKKCVCLNSRESYAVKIIEKSYHGGFWSPSAIARREAHILMGLKHENVVKFIDACSDDRFLYIVMERCTGGELFDRILSEKMLREVDAGEIFSQVLKSIEYIHGLNIVHRDIKPENFLLTGDGTRVKLIDFGLSVRLRSNEERLSALVGSAHYLAPEMIRQNYSKPVDMWSAGILLYLMLFGRYPFDGTEDQIMYAIKRRSPDYRNEWLSPRAIEFLQILLEKDYRKRLTATEALQHPFITCMDESTINPDEGDFCEYQEAILLTD